VTGHELPRHAPAARSPFAAAAPSIVLALVYLVAIVVWLVAGDRLPGGRWLAVHLFTLGVLTNLVLTFSEHFSRTLTRTPDERAAWWPLVTNLGILVTLVGLPARQPALVAAGTTVLVVVVFQAYRRLRRMRKQAVGARFTWIVRVYERAHGAFLHGAVIGGVLGVGIIPAEWHIGFRTAHLHANVLGWGGLTLLATLVFFGPTMARTRIEPGADDRAARALRHGATGLSAAVLLLLAAGAPDAWGTAARTGAAVGLAVLAWAGAAVCLPVARSAWRAKPTAPRLLVAAVAVWLPLVVAADAVVVATGAWRWLDSLGAAALIAVLGQAILATLTYLAPMLRGPAGPQRDVIRRRLEVASTAKAAAFQLAAVLAVVDSAPLQGVPRLFPVAWGLLVAVLVATAAAALLPPTRRSDAAAAA
jgi:hypothetical protein